MYENNLPRVVMIVEWLGVKPMTQLTLVWVFMHLTGFPLV